MSKLRWSDELDNFYPAGRTPGTSGTQFRGRQSKGHRATTA
jgi:hypothetical protein